MKRILAKAAVTAAASAAASLAIVAIVLPLIGGAVDSRAVVMSVVCPLFIAFPASLFLLRQKQKYADALAELTLAHERLADAHVELAEAHARLAEKARHDDMTGLLNRESFFSALKNTRRRTDRGMLLIIDADNFKYINDTHGHAQGDAALLLIAGAIAEGTREGDLVGRIGGIGDDEAMLVAERIRLGVESLRFSPGDGKYLPLSVSIGAARLRPHLSWSQMMREADLRLYEAKRRGRNRVVFEGERNAAA